MDKYKKLLSNAVILAVGTFSSKLLVFLLMPLYTHVLQREEFGSVDLIIQACNLLAPLVTVGIINSIVRFGLDRAYHKSDVFTTGLCTTLGGFLVLLLFWPLLNRIPFLTGQMVLIYLFLLMSNLRSLCSQFTRARGFVRLYAIDGILSTATTIVFNVLFLVVFQWGIMGYVLAIVSADFISVVFLFLTARLHQYINFRRLDRSVMRAMVRYALPMIPTTLFWWLTNVSDRYIVAGMLGTDMNGLFAISYKIPTVVTLVANIFLDAWQMSAVTENENGGREEFFSKVFGSYQAVLFAAASGLILFTKVITKLLVAPDFYESWRFVPFLVMAMAYSCMATFLGTVYVVEKRSVNSLVTTAIGACVNVALNFLMIPRYGVNGAGFATFLSYLLVVILRAADTHRFVRIDLHLAKTMLNTGVLLVQSVVLIMEPKYWILYEIGLCVAMLLLNMAAILANVQKLLAGRFGRRSANT